MFHENKKYLPKLCRPCCFYKQGVADQQVDEFILPDNIDDCIWAVQKPIAQIYGQLLWVHVCVNACLPLYIWGSKSQDILFCILLRENAASRSSGTVPREWEVMAEIRLQIIGIMESLTDNECFSILLESI